jgi:hypothetical protein
VQNQEVEVEKQQRELPRYILEPQLNLGNIWVPPAGKLKRSLHHPFAHHDELADTE